MGLSIRVYNKLPLKKKLTSKAYYTVQEYLGDKYVWN